MTATSCHSGGVRIEGRDILGRVENRNVLVLIESVEQVDRRADPGTAREDIVDQAPVESSDDAVERPVPETLESEPRRTRL